MRHPSKVRTKRNRNKTTNHMIQVTSSLKILNDMVGLAKFLVKRKIGAKNSGCWET